MAARLQHKDALWNCILHGCSHGIEVYLASCGIVMHVLLDGESGMLEQRIVVSCSFQYKGHRTQKGCCGKPTPAWRANVDGGLGLSRRSFGELSVEVQGADVVGSRASDSLARGDL